MPAADYLPAPRGKPLKKVNKAKAKKVVAPPRPDIQTGTGYTKPKAAPRPKPAPASWTRPIARADKPVLKAQAKAHRKTRQATRRIQANVVVPYAPKLRKPTAAQRGAAYSMAVQALGGQNIVPSALPPQQRIRLNRILGYGQTAQRRVDERIGRLASTPTPTLPPGLFVGPNGTITRAVRNRFTGQVSHMPLTEREVGALRLTPAAPAPRMTRRELEDYGRQVAAARRSQIKPGQNHTVLQAGFLPDVDLSAIGNAIGSITSLDTGDLGPRQFASGALGDVRTIATAPFIGGYELGAGGYEALAHGDTQRLQRLGSGLWEGVKHSFPGELAQGNFEAAAEQLRTHPLLSGLDVAGGVGVVGRGAGAVSRGAGAPGRRGPRATLGRAGSTVRPPLALADDAAVAKSGLLVERTYSKDLTRKAAQVAADRRREPLLDGNGKPVVIEHRGRQVPVLKASVKEKERELRKRGDFIASRANSVERLVRDEAVRANHRTRAAKGRLAHELVSLVIEGTVRSPATMVDDLMRHRKALEDAAQRGGFRHEGELAANRERAAFIDQVLSSPKTLKQAPKIFAEAQAQARHLNAREAEAIRLGLLDPQSAARSKLIPWAIEHMGARHISEKEHGRLERTARQLENSAKEAALKLPKGHPDRELLEAVWKELRAERIVISGRDRKAVLEHEQARTAHAAVVRKAEAADVAVARLERSRQRLVGAQSVQRGSAGAARMEAARGAPSRAEGVLRFIDRANADPRQLRAQAAKETQRARVLAKVDTDLAAAREVAKDARSRERTAARRAESTKLPPIRAGVRRPDGRPLPDEMIAEDIRRHRGGLDSVAYLPHRLDVRGGRSHHTQFRLGTRPVLDKETRTGEAYRRGSTSFGHELVHDEFVRKEIQIAKAEQLDRFVSEHSLRHPVVAKAETGAALTKAERRVVDQGGYFTAKEATEAAERLEADTGERMVAIRAVGAKLRAETRQEIQQELQSPQAFESLGQRLLNDRIVRPGDEAFNSSARNVVLVPAALVKRLEDHLKPAGDIQRFLQFANRAFRAAVLPQPRWLTGNITEPFAVRLLAKGSGVNVFGLGVDVRAAVKTVRAMERSGDPKMRRAVQEIRAQQFGGLLIGGRGASVRRTAEDLPGVLKTGAVVRHLPVVKQFGDLASGLLNSYFRANRVIEGLAQRAALGRSIRQSVQEFSGSWLETVRLGDKAAQEAARGLVGTKTQDRFMRAQHELLGKYEGFQPRVRELVQGAFPFAPWAMSAARFTFWTMPAHHTVLTDVLIKTEQTIDREWQEMHDAVPPGSLELALPSKDGGWIDVARYSPWGFSGPVVAGDLQAITDQAFPQVSGALSAVQGRDPFGRQLRVEPTDDNPSGEAGFGDRVAVAANSLLEAFVPFLATGRRLQEGGGTAYADSTILSPKTKPGTAHGMSALRRTFDPFRPVYMRKEAADSMLPPDIQEALDEAVGVLGDDGAGLPPDLQQVLDEALQGR